MPLKKTPDSVVHFKGFSSGILMSLDLDGYDFDRVLRRAASIYKKKKHYFGENVPLFATGIRRELNVDEGGMVRKMFLYLLNKEVHIYREKPLPACTKKETATSSPPKEKEHSSDSLSSLINQEDFLVIGKTIRAGVVVQSPGNIVVFGDIHSGAKVIAGKSLYVYGSIQGTIVFASQENCSKAILTCNQLQTAHIIAANHSIKIPLYSLQEPSVPVYVYYNNGATSIVKITDA